MRPPDLHRTVAYPDRPGAARADRLGACDNCSMRSSPDGSETPALARESAVFVWTDRALFVGDRSETSLHSHHAIELCLALDDLGIDIQALPVEATGARRASFRELLESSGAGLPEAESACSALIASLADEPPRAIVRWRVRRAMEQLDRIGR